MWFQLIRHAALAVFTALGVATLSFMALAVAPGDPAEALAIARYGTAGITQQRIEQVREENGLNAPRSVQFVRWLGRAATGDLGRGMVRSVPVSEEISHRLLKTAQIAATAITLSLLIAIPCGILSAARPGRWLDRACSIAGLLGAATPGICTALLLTLVFGLWLGWLPVAGSHGASSLVLPVLTLAAANAAWTMKMLRASMIEVLEQPFIRAAYARGFPEKTILFRLALKPALAPVVNIAGAQFLLLLEGSVLVEAIFAWPGVGRLLVESALARDYPMILGCTLVFGLACVLVNSGTDVLAAYLDPRQVQE